MFTEFIKQKFLSKCEITDDCWIWKAGKMPQGYGSFSVNRKTYSAHRFSWRMFIGEVPPGLFVCHKRHCNNKACVNPNHLYLGTNRENQLDSVATGNFRNQNTNKTHCPCGHPLSGENLVIIKSTGSRSCRECRRLQNRNYMRRRRHKEKENE
jgi:hypothetical protein